MLKGTLFASMLALALAPSARAANPRTATLDPRSALTQRTTTEVVQTERPSPVGIVARDAIGGAILGAAIGGGVSVYNRYVSDSRSWGNWERNLAIGAGIGLGVGLLVGVVDAASNADRTFTGPVADQRDPGFAPAVATYAIRY
jgi:hypothetical protein